MATPTPVTGPEGRDRGWLDTGTVWPGIDGESPAPPVVTGPVRRTAQELRGLKPSEVAAILEADGVSRSEAVYRACKFARFAAWRRWRHLRSEPEGRQPRWRGDLRAASFELKRLREEERANGLRLGDEESNRAPSGNGPSM